MTEVTTPVVEFLHLRGLYLLDLTNAMLVPIVFVMDNLHCLIVLVRHSVERRDVQEWNPGQYCSGLSLARLHHSLQSATTGSPQESEGLCRSET